MRSSGEPEPLQHDDLAGAAAAERATDRPQRPLVVDAGDEERTRRARRPLRRRRVDDRDALGHGIDPERGPDGIERDHRQTSGRTDCWRPSHTP